MLEASDTRQFVFVPAKLEDSDPDKSRVDGLDEHETLGILEYMDRLEEVTKIFLKRLVNVYNI